MGLNFSPQMFRPSLIMRLVVSAAEITKTAKACICLSLLLVIGSIYLALQTKCTLRPLTSSSSLRWLLFFSSKVIGTLGAIRLLLLWFVRLMLQLSVWGISLILQTSNSMFGDIYSLVRLISATEE